MQQVPNFMLLLFTELYALCPQDAFLCSGFQSIKSDLSFAKYLFVLNICVKAYSFKQIHGDAH